MMRKLGLWVVALAIGCNSSAPPAAPESRPVELRVLGTNIGRLTAALVEVKDGGVTAAGRKLAQYDISRNKA